MASVVGAASCVTPPPQQGLTADALEARVEEILARRGLGRDALSVVDNVIRHDMARPPAAPAVVRELLARPVAAADAAALFRRAVPPALRGLAGELSEPAEDTHSAPIELRELLDPYLEELAAAQRVLRTATRGAGIDGVALLRQLETRLPSDDMLNAVVAAIDPDAIERATDRFLEATARFVRRLRAAQGRVRYPDQALRFDAPIGPVSIGTRGPDRHGPDAAVIVDPGGDDRYERRPATGGAISVIVDLGGNDRYRGADVALHGLSALVDLAGNDRYEMKGPGLGAALGGAALLIDFSGDDRYEGGLFSQGAAAFGFGALIDLDGDDLYLVRAGGQGFATAGGVGLLWDRRGNDRYTASGMVDALERGAGIGFAQGAAYGLRTMLGGGVGILRDDAGNDRYEAGLFAQGAGYYQGAGLLWDGAGEDAYRAVRYAQGAGVHEAIGVLRDEAGSDEYELGVGVGQGMGLDLAVGLLFDGGGDDRYRASMLSQGSASANGFGLLADAGGENQWRMGADRRAWGGAQWARGLPSVGLLVYEPAGASFVREGAPLAQGSSQAALGGPHAGAPIVHEAEAELRCPSVDPATSPGGIGLEEGLRRMGAGIARGAPDAAAYGDVLRGLSGGLQAGLGGLPREDFVVHHALGVALRCALRLASAEEAQRMEEEMERVLMREPASPFAGAFAAALRERPVALAPRQRLLELLDAHPQCGVRSAALALRQAWAQDEASRASWRMLAYEALRASCWRLRAQALKLLGAADGARAPAAVMPRFLDKSTMRGEDRIERKTR